jgi:hypothetical protein
MKKLVLTVWMAAIAVFGGGQTLHDYWMTSAPEGGGFAQFDSAVRRHIEALQTPAQTGEVKNLFRVYRKTGKKFLHRYRPLANFSDLSRGEYDCLTATALFSVILKELQLPYTVMETNYHIFLLVHLPSGDVLIETTDRLTGFVTNAREIERIKHRYVGQTAAAASRQRAYEYPFYLNQPVSDVQLNGLLLYNQAVKAYNERSLKNSDHKLREAEQFYRSERTRTLHQLIVLTRAVAS